MTIAEAPSILDARLREELALLAREESCTLLEIELVGGVLRFVIDHPDGVTVDHCALFSKQASALLDVEEFGAGGYLLEVTSPGLNRKLYGPGDYRRFRGRLSRITFRDEQGKRRTVIAELQDLDDSDGGTVTLRERESGEVTTVPLAGVEKARLEIDL